MISSSTRFLLLFSSAALSSAVWVPFLNVNYPTVFDNPAKADDALDEIQGRIFTSSGGISISNSTLSISALATAGLLALLFALSIGPNGGNAASRNTAVAVGDVGERRGFGFHYSAPPTPPPRWKRYFSRGVGDNRSGLAYSATPRTPAAVGQRRRLSAAKRNRDEDLATMMFELAQAFKKHEVTEPPCQRYVACEASQESRIDQNGSFAKLVNRIMREMDSRHGARAVRAKDSFVYDLLTEFKRGRDAFLIGGIDDACAALRNTCYRTASTKNNERPTGSTSTTSYDHGGYGRSEEFGQKVNF